MDKNLAGTVRIHSAVSISNPLHKYPWILDRAELPEGKRPDYCLDSQDVLL